MNGVSFDPADIQRERERVHQRAVDIGFAEMARRHYLYDDAQRLCNALVWRKDRSNPRIQRLLERAEDRRERRARYCWG